MSDTWRNRPGADRSARIRVVPEPRADTPGGVPSLTKSFLRDMPPWQKFVIGLVLSVSAGGGLSLAGAAKFMGVETKADADARETRLLERITRGETALTELRQSMRKEGLSKAAKGEIAKILADAISVAPPRAKHKTKPMESKPAEPEETTP